MRQKWNLDQSVSEIYVTLCSLAGEFYKLLKCRKNSLIFNVIWSLLTFTFDLQCGKKGTCCYIKVIFKKCMLLKPDFFFLLSQNENEKGKFSGESLGRLT